MKKSFLLIPAFFISTVFAHNPSYNSAAKHLEFATSTPIPVNKSLGADSWKKLHSFKYAPATILLDFDGGTFDSEYWAKYNDGNHTFVLRGIDHDSVDEAAVWDAAAEYFRPFEINITTDKSYFSNQPENRRVRVVIGPDPVFNTVSASAIKSFGTAPIPFVSIVSDATNIGRTAKTIAHEVGHTLGLFHDNSYNTSGYNDYYSGGAWGPIMGGYGYSITQWSRGEYKNAANREDDIGIVASVTNGFGIREDEHQNSFAGSTLLDVSGTTVNSRGIIESNGDQDAFYFKLQKGGAVNLTIKTDNHGSSLDIKATLLDSDGTVIQVSNDKNRATASLSTSLDSGEYLIRIEGDSWNETFDTDYGSLGSYLISGTVTGFDSNGAAPLNSAPTISDINNIAYSSLLWNGISAIDLTFEIFDEDGSITSAKLLVDEDTIPFSGNNISWTPRRDKDHLLTIVVEDDQGAIVQRFIPIRVELDTTNEVDSEKITAIDFSSQSDSPYFVKSYASYSCDGSDETSWTTLETSYLDVKTGTMVEAKEYPHYITYDLAESREISSMVIDFGSATDMRRAKNYTVYGSTNASDWIDLTGVVETYSGYANDIIVLNTGASYRYFKWEAHESLTINNGASIREVRFFEGSIETANKAPIISVVNNNITTDEQLQAH